MKTLFTPLKHPKTILIVIIFFTLFLVFSLLAPAQTALGNRNNDEDFEPNTGHAPGYDGGDGNSGGRDASTLHELVGIPPNGARFLGTVNGYDVYGSTGSFGLPEFTTQPTNRDNGGGGGGVFPHPTPTGTIYGDINFWGHGYAGRDRLCPGDTVPPEQNCNASCIALTGWACDTRPHTDIVTIGIYVNNELYDTLQPTFADSTVNTHCGSNPDNPTNNFRYPTPLAWKDGVPRTVTIKATRPSDNLSVNLVHAPWHGPTSFQVTCPVPLLPTIDLTGSLGTVADQIKDVPFAVDTVIKNQGTLAATSSIKVYLQFDYGDDGWHLDTNGDFRIISTVNALGIGDQVNHTFPDITIPKIGDWKVRLMVDPGYLVEPGTSLYQSNNKTSWVSFFVNNPPSTAPELTFWADPPSVRKGPTATTTLTWIGRNIVAHTCTASRAWNGSKNNSGNQTVLVGNIRTTKNYRLSCTGTDGSPISKIASVDVTDTTPTSGITINFSADPSIIRSGGSTRIYLNIETDHDASCVVTSPDGSRTFTFTEGNSSADFQTAPLTNYQRFTISCVPSDNPDNEPAVTKSIDVEVIPVAQEV